MGLPSLDGLLLSLLLLHLLSGVVSGAEKPSCDCSDVDARIGEDKHLKFVRHRCWESYLNDECEKRFMFNTVKELPEGFCRISCGRCDCCPTFRYKAQTLNLTEWIWAMDVAGLSTYLDGHGFEAAVLAPRDGSLSGLMDRLGWNKDEIEESPEMQYALGEILKFNMIAPIPNNYAVYSSLFLNAGMNVATLFSELDTLEVRKWDSGGTGFQGPHGSATVQDTEFDYPTCKGYIFISDQYNLPFANADHLTTIPGEAYVTKGLCHTAENTLYDGDAISTVKADSATECCDACGNTGECNVWTWCARGSGCSKGGRTEFIEWGTCTLSFSASVAKGGDPESLERSVITPYHSGHIARPASPGTKKIG